MTEDNPIQNGTNPATSLEEVGLLAVYNDLSTKLTDKKEEKKRITIKYETDIAQIDTEIKLIEKTVEGLQQIYDASNIVVPIVKKAPIEAIETTEEEKVVLPVEKEDILPTISEKKEDEPTVKEDEPKPGERGALRYAIIRAVSDKDDFLTNDEVFDYLTEQFPKYGFLKRNVISGLKDARQAKAIIGVPVDGPGRTSFVHGLPEFFTIDNKVSTLKEEYLEKLIQKLEAHGLSVGNISESEKREVSDLEASEKKLPSASTDGNAESETNRETPSIDAEVRLNGFSSGLIEFT